MFSRSAKTAWHCCANDEIEAVKLGVSPQVLSRRVCVKLLKMTGNILMLESA
jgi:hypothetical protein